MRIGLREIFWVPKTEWYIPCVGVTVGRWSLAISVRYVGGNWYKRFGKHAPSEDLECFEIGEAMRADFKARQA